MKNTSALLVLASALTLPVAASPALANTITFGTGSVASGFTSPVTEDGFTYSTLSGKLVLDILGHPGQDMEGDELRGGGVLKIVRAGGGNFVFDALDFAAFDESGTGSQTLDVEGFLGGTSVGTDQFTLANTSDFHPTFPNWTTEAASVLAGVTVSELDIPLNGTATSSPPIFFEAIDNVALTPVGTPVPESSTWAMMLLGFAGLGYAGYRRRRSAVAAAV
jgi:hypothetical protein